MKAPRIPDSLRPRDPSFGPGLLWAVVSLLAGVWMAGNADAIARVAPLAGAAMFVLPIVYLGASILLGRRDVRRSRRWDLAKDGNPYPAGLQPMDAAHEAVIFGRDDEIRRIVNRVRFDTALSRRFVPLEGPSGCGKSSLLRAGVLPELRTGVRRFGLPRVRAFDVVGPMTPGSDPVRALLGAVGVGDASDSAVSGIEAMARAAVGALSKGETPDPPHALLTSLRDRRDSGERSVIAVDQIEELAALDPMTRRGFLALLYALLRHDRRVVVICTLRSDMSGEFLDEVGGELFRDTEKIAAMQRSQLRQVVKGPALATGVIIEDDLVDRMVDEADGADALPLLSFVLHGLYERSLKDGRISAAEYDAAMGDDNAISRYADETVAACSQSLQVDAEALVIGVLLEGVSIVDGRVLRRDFDSGSLSAQERSVAEFLQRARMLTLNAGRYEVTHEVLLRRWPTLTHAIAQSHELLRARTLLDQRAREWAQEGEPRSLLLSAGELARIGDTSARFRGLVGRFVAASVSNDVTELRRRADLAAEHSLLAMDPPAVASKPDLALALARAANEELQQTLSTSFALYRCWWYGLRGILRTRSGGVAAVAWSPDGSLLATAGEDNFVELWRPKARTGPQVLSHTDRVSAVAWSPDGSLLATAGYDGSVHLWSPDGGEPRSSLGHDGPVIAVEWSPDGSRVATAGEDHMVRLWSADGVLCQEFAAHSKRVRALAWSPDGARLASAGDDCLVRISSREGYSLSTLVGHSESVRLLAWSRDAQQVASGGLEGAVRLWSGDPNHPQRLAGHRGAVTAVAWSSDSTRLASAGVDQMVRVWSETGEPLHELGGHSGTVIAIAWSPTARALASGGVDRTVQLWSDASSCVQSIAGHVGTIHAIAWSPDGGVIATAGVDRSIRTWTSAGEPLHLLSGHSDRVQAVSWSPDGSLLASGGHDMTVRLWSRADDQVAVLQGHTGALKALAWSPPDGALLATAGADGCILIWSRAGALVSRLEGHAGPVSALAWSADGERLATTSHDQSVRLWARDGDAVAVLLGHSGPVNDVAWSPDSSRLATASHDHTIRVWSSGGSVLHQLVGHTDRVHAVAWSPDGRRLASGSSDATVRIWPDPVGVPALLEQVQNIVGLPALTSDERRKALLPLRDAAANSP